ncbi:MAG: 30S ribosomal protein S11 [Candidatus Kerfeldbacteria bacterium]|nr:30S ribosomal protein S11 [Candidatus Kerfeldbacteria bacterium]
MEEEKKQQDDATTAAASATATVAPKKKSKGKKKKQVTRGRVYIQASYNNTIVTFTDLTGNTLSQSSAGRCGFKGPKKSTPYAAGVIVKNAVEKLADIGLKDIDVLVMGIGSGREGAIRALNAQGLNIMSIEDKTPMPHNGCRPKKPRRM